MELIRNLHRDEIRNGYIVTSELKKIWHRELEIWQELDRICRKHEITYFAGYGTLLGAARHGGVIPWDIDMDFIMMRPEFDRFSQIVENELAESGGIFEIGTQEFHALNIVHSQTTLIENRAALAKNKKYGLGIDIFAQDVALDGTNSGFFAYNSLNELMGTIFNFPAIVNHVQSGGKTVNDWKIIETLHNLPDLGKKYEFIHGYATKLFNQSSCVGWIGDMVRNSKKPMQKSWFGKKIFLPFENVELPAPAAYDEVLTACYGDWHKFVRDSHTLDGTIYSVDIPWREFFKQADWDIVFPKK